MHSSRQQAGLGQAAGSSTQQHMGGVHGGGRWGSLRQPGAWVVLLGRMYGVP